MTQKDGNAPTQPRVNPQWQARPIHPLLKILIGLGILLFLAMLFVVFFTKDGVVNLFWFFIAIASILGRY